MHQLNFRLQSGLLFILIDCQFGPRSIVTHRTYGWYPRLQFSKILLSGSVLHPWILKTRTILSMTGAQMRIKSEYAILQS